MGALLLVLMLMLMLMLIIVIVIVIVIEERNTGRRSDVTSQRSDVRSQQSAQRRNISTSQHLSCFCYQLIVNGYLCESVQPGRLQAWSLFSRPSLDVGCWTFGVGCLLCHPHRSTPSSGPGHAPAIRQMALPLTRLQNFQPTYQL